MISSTPNVINLTGAPQLANPTPGLFGASGAPGIGNNYAFRTFTSSSQARVAAMTAQKKVIQYAIKHPEHRAISNKILEILMSHW
ncbi:hypothetical protein QWZ18_12460 [Methylobacterium longum]|uniref:Uncharacterized protein n=1 Tax=Methylobacterium longum TaxID=767694 RepID=A0ABT8ANR7_9HYPH|nr:hypothetical protein [Methylobacterium longum]